MNAPDSLTLGAALLAGLAGSTHCFAMCGGMAGALGMRVRATPTASSAFIDAGSYQLGRIAGYTLAGALFGLAGAALQATFDLMRIGAVLRIASGVLLILIALRILIRWNGLHALELLGAKFWSKLQPLARTAAQSEGPGRALMLGFLWGWLPCGLVYSMLAFAATSGSAATGAAIMAAFGIGTLPSMLTSTLFAAQIQRLLAQRWARQVTGLLLLAFGVWIATTGFAPAHLDPAGHAH